MEKTKFLVKGTAFINLKKYTVERLNEEVFLKAAEKAGLPKLILASSWYELQQLKVVCEIISKELNLSENEFFKVSTIYNLEVSLNSVYKFFIKASGAQSVLKKLPQITKTFADFLFVSVVDNKPGYFKYHYEIPATYFEWYIFGIDGAISGILNICKQPLKTFRVSNEKMIKKNNEDYTSSYLEITF